MLKEEKEYLIESYHRHIRELITELGTTTFAASLDKQKEEISQKLSVLYNKLTLTNLMGNRTLLAITGLQGTGKTTILKTLYDLPASLLPVNSSRGERLPVFITEKDVQVIETYVYRAKSNENGLSVGRESISIEKFNEISLYPLLNKDLWLECIVPNRYLFDENKSIVLLPGFEKDNEDISQMLLEHILYLSTSSVMVLRKDTYARESTQIMMRKVKEVYRNVKPIIALSFGNINPEQNDKFKLEILQEFEIEPAESNRVVVTGQGPDYPQTWKQELMASIDTYCYRNSTTDNLQTQLILNLTKQIDDVMLDLRKMMEQEMKSRQLNNQLSGDRYDVLLQFEVQYKKYLSDLEEAISSELSRRVKPSTDELRNYLAANASWTKELKTKFFGQRPEELYALENKIHAIWNNPNNKQVSILNKGEEKPETYLEPNLEILKVVSNYVAQEGKQVIKAFDDKKEINDSGQELSPLELMMQEISATEIRSPQLLESTPIDRIDAYFTNNDTLPTSLKHDDYKTMAVMGAMLIRESFIAQDIHENGHATLDEKLLDKASAEFDLASNMNQLAVVAPKLLKSIPLILGVDGIIDGELDLVNHAVSALSSVGISITAPQLLAIMGAGFAAAYAAKAIQESMRKANERQLQLAQAGERVFNELPLIQAKAFTNSLRRIYERMADQLLSRHLELSGQHDKVGEVEQINYTIRKISLLSNKIKREKYEQTVFI
ncbi:hypothetical protein [Paenisporosarcina sp. NPDC076907]|uniref:hypothetical protein n=1 Tax=Paenisporosarcina sp. NPDC076907 TaxID=3390604 RepID=UPI003D06E352